MIDYGTYRGLTGCVNRLINMKKSHVIFDEPLDLMEELRAVEVCWVAMTRHDTDDGEPDLLRVSVHDNGKFDIVDFTTPSKNGRLLYTNVPQEGIPAWMIESISMLRITEAREPVQSVGFKVHDKLYYIVDKRGENE